jgi:peptidyl-prolyl cis-trans isomerase A (cyclophilin A)
MLLTTAVGAEDPASEESQLHPALLDPSLATKTAPDSYHVKLETTTGDIVIEVIREWAPNGADRFYNLIDIGYYDDTAFYRVIPNFMAQVGMHGNPRVTARWSFATIPDDPILHANSRGTVTFAMRNVADSRTTQIFINFVDNSYLKMHGNFAPFGRVVQGMDVVDSLYSLYGEGSPRGKGPSQSRILTEGNDYLKAQFPQLDYIRRASLVEAPAGDDPQ